MYEERSTQPLHARVDAVRTYINSHTCPTVDPKRIDSAEQVRVDAVRTYVHQLETPTEMDLIEVAWYVEDGRPRWTVAATFNRRLVVFRLLAIFLPDKFRFMEVKRVPMSSRKLVHESGIMRGKPYHSTKCYGIYVGINKDRVLQYHVGRNLTCCD